MRFSILILSFIVFSCSNKKNYKFELVKSDSISIPIDENTSFISANTHYYNMNNESVFLFQNPNMKDRLNEILFFDIKSKILLKKLVFSDRNGYFESINGFTPIGKDSLLLSNGLTDTLYISDINAKILYKKYFSFGKDKDFMAQVVPFNSKPIKFIDNKIYFSKSIWQDNRNDFKKSNFIFSYDIKSDLFNRFKVYFPNEYIESEYFSNEISYCFDEKNIIISPLNSHDIWIVDLKTQKLIKKEIKSDFFREFLKYSKEPVNDMQQGMFNNAFYSQYVNIVYDNYRKVYYRFFYPGINIKKEDKNLTNEYNHPKKMSIMVLDENFNKIGEQLFPNYDFKMDYFVAPDGLYINSNNEMNRNFKEDKLKYTKLILVKNEK